MTESRTQTRSEPLAARKTSLTTFSSLQVGFFTISALPRDACKNAVHGAGEDSLKKKPGVGPDAGHTPHRKERNTISLAPLVKT